MISKRSNQHLVSCLGALGLGVVMPCILPAGILAATAGAAGGLAGNLLSNWLQKHLDQRENDPSLPDRNHDLLRVIANAVSHEIGEYQRNHPDASAQPPDQLRKLAADCPKAFLALFETGELPDIAPPDAKTLLTASARDQRIPAVGGLEDWRTIIRRLCSHTGTTLTPDTEEALAAQLHSHLWESVRKALKRDFAHDGKGYAALHLQFMGDVMARLDDLAQPHRDHAAATELTRELLEELRQHKAAEADPKARRILDKAPPGTQTKLHILMQRYETLSTRVDRGFDQILDELRAADRAARGRDQTTHRRLAWSLVGLAALGLISAAGYLALNRSQQDQRHATEQVQQDLTGLRTDVQATALSLDAFRIEATALVDRYLAANYELNETIQDRDAEIERIASALREAQAAADNGDELAEQALAEVRKTGDLKLLQETLARIADEHYQRDQGKYKARKDLYIDRCREIASIAWLRGDLEEVQHRHTLILSLAPDDFSSRKTLATLQEIRGNYDQAIQEFSELHDLSAGNKYHQAICLERIGLIYKDQGKYDEAEANYFAAFRLLWDDETKDIGFLSGLSNSMGQLALARLDYEAAKELFQNALDGYGAMGDIGGQAAVLGNYGLVYKELGDHKLAEQYFRESLALCVADNNRMAQARQYGNLGIIMREQGRYDEAKQFLQQAQSIFESVGDRLSLANVFLSLGWTHYFQDEIDPCIDCFNQAMDIYIEIGSLEGQAAMYANMGSVAHRIGKTKEARILLMASHDLFIEIGSPNQAAKIKQVIETLPAE